jgi:ankyrin repeat protein
MKKPVFLTILFVSLLSLTGCDEGSGYPLLKTENDNSLEIRKADNANLKDIKQRIKDETDTSIKDMLLMDAIYNGYLESVKYLVENHADINEKNQHGVTPLFIAVNREHLEIVKYLVEKGANVNMRNDEDEVSVAIIRGGSTPLLVAASNGHLEIVKYLVENGADVNVKCAYDTTPLMCAAVKGHLEVVKYLIAEADVNVKDAHGKTPLDCAISSDNSEVVKYLVKSGAVQR